MGEKGWTGSIGIGSPGRTGPQYGFGNQGSILLPSGNQPTVIAGFAFNNQSWYATRNLFSFDQMGTAQVTVQINANLGINVVANGATLGTTVNGLVAPTGWTHIQIKVVAGTGAAGSVIVQVNSVQVLSVTGTTLTGTNTSYAGVSLYGIIPIDDLYINNGLGTVHNSFEGDIKIVCYYPDAAGTYSQWTPLTGPNYAQVNEALVDNDTSYVYTATTGAMDTYKFGPFTLPSGGAITDVQAVAIARKDDAGAHQVAQVIRSGGANVVGTPEPVMNSYTCFRTIYPVDPATAAPWTLAGLNAAEFGEELIS